MLAASVVALGDGWGISANPNLVKPNLVKPHFGENSHRIEINLVRILTELAFQFYRVFSSFFFNLVSFVNSVRILTELGTSTGAAHRNQPILVNSVGHGQLGGGGARSGYHECKKLHSSGCRGWGGARWG